MISQLYTLLAHLRAWETNVLLDLLVFDCGRGGGEIVREQIFTRHIFWGREGGGAQSRRQVEDRAIEQKGRRGSVDRVDLPIGATAPDRSLLRRGGAGGHLASKSRPSEPTGRTPGKKLSGRTLTGNLQAAHRHQLEEVFGTLTLLSTRSCGGLEAMDRQFGEFRGVLGRRGTTRGRAPRAGRTVVGRAGILKSSPCTAPRGPRCGGEPEVSAHLEYPLDERCAVLHVPRGVGVEPPSLLGPLALAQGPAPRTRRCTASPRRVCSRRSLAELGEGGSPEGRPQRRSSLRGELGGLRLVELALPRAEAGGIGQRLVVADEEIVVAERVRLEPVRRTRGLRTDVVPGPAVIAVAVLAAGPGEGVLVGPDQANPKSTAPNMLAMVLSNVAERCVTVGGGARVGSRAFTERVYPPRLHSSRRAESVVFSRCRVAPSVAPLRSPRACFPACACAGAWMSLGVFPITQLDFRCVSRPRVLPNGETFPDRTKLGVKVKFRPESSTARACNTFCMERQSDCRSHSLATLSAARAVRKNRQEYRTGGEMGSFLYDAQSRLCARQKIDTDFRLVGPSRFRGA